MKTTTRQRTKHQTFQGTSQALTNEHTRYLYQLGVHFSQTTNIGALQPNLLYNIHRNSLVELYVINENELEITITLNNITKCDGSDPS